MSNIELQFMSDKLQISCGKYKKELSHKTAVEIYKLFLSDLIPNRDFATIGSLHKLVHILELECEPDCSDPEDGEKKVSPKRPTTIKNSAKVTKQPITSKIAEESESGSESE